MSRRKTYPLRTLQQEEREELEAISREVSGPAAWMIRAKILLAVAEGKDYQVAAAGAGRRDGDRVAALVKRFNAEGMRALTPRHGGGPAVK